MEGARRRSSWSDIPLELAGLVLCCLPAHVDRVRFAAVCLQWRSAAQQVPLPPLPPLLALKDGTFYSMPGGEPFRSPGCSDGFITSSGNWLVYNRLHCLLLVDPFSIATMTLPAPPRIFLLHSMDMVVVKLIVCSSHLIAALLKGGCSFWIAVCRPGASSWSVAWKFPILIFDIAFYQDKLYAVSYNEDLLALDVSMDNNSIDNNTGDPQVAMIGNVISGGRINLDRDFLRVLYLIESRGSLLMVRRRIFHGHTHGKGQIHTFAKQCKPELAVFEADFEQSRWAKVMTLGDNQALFLGPCSRAVCMPQCDLLNKRVWFLDDYKKYQSCSRSSSSSDTNDRAIRKFSCPLPMISWTGHNGCAGAVWLFPPN